MLILIYSYVIKLKTSCGFESLTPYNFTYFQKIKKGIVIQYTIQPCCNIYY